MMVCVVAVFGNMIHGYKIKPKSVFTCTATAQIIKFAWLYSQQCSLLAVMSLSMFWAIAVVTCAC